MPSVKQQALTSFFSARKAGRTSIKSQVTDNGAETLKKVQKLSEGLKEIQSRKPPKSPELNNNVQPKAFEQFKSLLKPKVDEIQAETVKPVETKVVEKPASAKGKSALSRLEAKRAILRAAREKLKQVEDDSKLLQEVQTKTKPKLEELKSERVDIPAYEKYRYLAIPKDSDLPLPKHYQILYDGFQAADTIVSMFHNRNEICRLEKLSQAVSKMTKRDFSLNQLEMIEHLCKNLYNVTVEEHRFMDSTQRYHHIVSFKDTPTGPTFLKKRKLLFKEKLIERTAQYHQEFMEKNFNSIEVPMELLKRWHPKFNLDQVPQIPQANLPKLPTQVVTTNANELLAKVRGKYSSRIEKALETLTTKKTDEVEKSPTVKVSGVNSKLLERIRAKEALKMAEMMVMQNKDEVEKRVLVDLPEMIKVIRQIFLSAQKAAIPEQDLHKKIMDSKESTFTSEEVSIRLTKLSEVLPDWFKLLTVRNTKFVKIDKNKDINQLNIRISNLIKNMDEGSAKSI